MEIFMKNLFASFALACLSVFSFAQNPSIIRPRIEIAESGSEEDVGLMVFYMDDESPRTYYLSLGPLGIGTEIVQVGFDPIFELFIPLGNTLDEAIAKMEEIKGFYQLPKKETAEIEVCFAALYPNDTRVTATVTPRRLLISRMLEFSIPTDTEGVVRATHIDKSDFSILLGGLKLHKRLHPSE